MATARWPSTAGALCWVAAAYLLLAAAPCSARSFVNTVSWLSVKSLLSAGGQLDERNSSRVPVLILDVDALYERDCGIEQQIRDNFQQFAHQHYGLDKKECDRLQEAYGSGIRGIVEEITGSRDVLVDYFNEVYPNLDLSRLRRYSHPLGSINAQDVARAHKVLLNLTIPIVVVSDGPMFHVRKVLQRLGLSTLPATYLTPDHRDGLTKGDSEFWKPVIDLYPTSQYQHTVIDTDGSAAPTYRIFHMNTLSTRELGFEDALVSFIADPLHPQPLHRDEALQRFACEHNLPVNDSLFSEVLDGLDGRNRSLVRVLDLSPGYGVVMFNLIEGLGALARRNVEELLYVALDCRTETMPLLRTQMRRLGLEEIKSTMYLHNTWATYAGEVNGMRVRLHLTDMRAMDGEIPQRLRALLDERGYDTIIYAAADNEKDENGDSLMEMGGEEDLVQQLLDFACEEGAMVYMPRVCVGRTQLLRRSDAKVEEVTMSNSLWGLAKSWLGAGRHKKEPEEERSALSIYVSTSNDLVLPRTWPADRLTGLLEAFVHRDAQLLHPPHSSSYTLTTESSSQFLMFSWLQQAVRKLVLHSDFDHETIRKWVAESRRAMPRVCVETSRLDLLLAWTGTTQVVPQSFLATLPSPEPQMELGLDPATGLIGLVHSAGPGTELHAVAAGPLPEHVVGASESEHAPTLHNEGLVSQPTTEEDELASELPESEGASNSVLAIETTSNFTPALSQWDAVDEAPAGAHIARGEVSECPPPTDVLSATEGGLCAPASLTHELAVPEERDDQSNAWMKSARRLLRVSNATLRRLLALSAATQLVTPWALGALHVPVLRVTVALVRWAGGMSGAMAAIAIALLVLVPPERLQNSSIADCSSDDVAEGGAVEHLRTIVDRLPAEPPLPNLVDDVVRNDTDDRSMDTAIEVLAEAQAKALVDVDFPPQLEAQLDAYPEPQPKAVEPNPVPPLEALAHPQHETEVEAVAAAMAATGRLIPGQSSCSFLTFPAPHEVRLQTALLPVLLADEVLVETLVSLASAGVEGKAFEGLQTRSDGQIDSPVGQEFALVGTVRHVGDDVDSGLRGRKVLVWGRHATASVVKASDAVLLDDEDLDDAPFLPAVEAAVSLMMAAQVVTGQRVCVVGQGLVGLLAAATLRVCLPRLDLTVVEPEDARRTIAQRFLHGLQGDAQTVCCTPSDAVEDFDVVIEVSGQMTGLQYATDHTRRGGQVVIGSWYAADECPQGPLLRLGDRFHRNEMQLVTSQVAHIPAHFRAAWSKKRRLQLSRRLLGALRPRELLRLSKEVYGASASASASSAPSKASTREDGASGERRGWRNVFLQRALRRGELAEPAKAPAREEPTGRDAFLSPVQCEARLDDPAEVRAALTALLQRRALVVLLRNPHHPPLV